MPFVLGDPTQSSPEIHVDDVSTQFITTVYNQDEAVQDLSLATAINFRFYTPSRETRDRTGALYTNGLDGKIVYTLIAGDIDEAGTWKFQCILGFSGGTWSTNIEEFTVYPNLPAPIVP
jgi:hypothetical protein